jgi:hypothetical protein
MDIVEYEALCNMQLCIIPVPTPAIPDNHILLGSISSSSLGRLRYADLQTRHSGRPGSRSPRMHVFDISQQRIARNQGIPQLLMLCHPYAMHSSCQV